MIDLRNVYRPEDVAAHGFTYDSVGRLPADGGEQVEPARRAEGGR